jgi:carboxyl-terminal processing protease
MLRCQIYALITFAFLFTCGANSSNNDRQLQKLAAVYMQVADRVAREYVEDVDQRKMLDGALRGMLESLDQNSTYYTKSKHKEIKNQTAGVYGGLGIEITSKDGYVLIVSPLDDSPAMMAGLKSGDMIVKVDGESIYNVSLLDVSEQLKGPPGSSVKITINRSGNVFDVSLIRKILQNHPVKHLIFKDIAYIRMSTFNDLSHKELLNVLQHINNKYSASVSVNNKLQNHGKRRLRGYIIDVRDNSGGLFDQAISVSEEFLKKGDLIVSIRGKHPDNNASYRSSKNGTSLNVPVVVMVNGGSASASEIFAGALQDHGRANIFGIKSFGKGSVQTVFPLPEGDAIKVTTAYYFTPSGRTINKTGIAPDVNWQPKLTSREVDIAKDVFEPSWEKRLLQDEQFAQAVQLIELIAIKNSIPKPDIMGSKQ